MSRGVDIDGRVLTRSDLTLVANRYGWEVREIVVVSGCVVHVYVERTPGERGERASEMDHLASNLNTMVPFHLSVNVHPFPHPPEGPYR